MYPLKQSTAQIWPFFLPDSNGDAVTGKVSGDFTKRISKGSGAFGAMTVTITEKEGGWYDLEMDTGHTNTLGILSVYLTVTGAQQVNLQWVVTASGYAGANLTHIDGGATTGPNATLNLAGLSIVSPSGVGVTVQAGGNQAGIQVFGSGSGAGIDISGGDAAGGTPAGAGIFVIGGTASTTAGGAAGEGIVITGGAGAASTNGAAPGVKVMGGSNTIAGGPGLDIQGTGDESGIAAKGTDAGHGLSLMGGSTGSGMVVAGGPSSGDGIRATVTDGVEFRTLPSFTVQTDGGNSATTLKTDRTETDNDHWANTLAVIRTGILRGQVRKISAYNGTTKVVTLETGFTGTPADGVVIDLINQ